MLDIIENINFGIELEYLDAPSKKVIKFLRKIKPVSDKYYGRWNYSTDYEFTEEKNGILYGGEVKSRILSNDKKSLNEIKKVLRCLNNLGANIDDRVGLHYHIDTLSLKQSKKNLIKFFILYSVYEPIIYKFCYNGKNPRSSLFKYAQPCRNIICDLLDDIENKSFQEMLDMVSEYIPFKMYGINYVPQLNTFEFRMSNMTLDFETILNELNMFCNLILSYQKQYDEEYINYKLKKIVYDDVNSYFLINEKEADEFSNIIFNNDKSKEKFILQYLK